MALVALQEKRSGKKELTDLQEQYLDILLEEYGGIVPHGEKTKIAERLGCDVSYLSQMDCGHHPAFTREKERRLRENIYMDDPIAQISALQRMLESVIDARKREGLPLTKKDPVDVVDTIRKISQGEAANKRPSSQTAVFNFQGMGDKELSDAIDKITGMLRSGDTEDIQQVIDGSYKEVDE